MNLNNKPKYIRIIGDKEYIDKSETESIAINSLLSENSFLICELNRNAYTNFIYGNNLAEISPEDVGSRVNDNNTCLFERLVNHLFIQKKAIKKYFEQNRANEVYFNRIKCSLLLINNKTEDPDSECIYDLFQGLNNPLVIGSEDGVNSLNVLQVDINDPIQLFNIINVAKRLQLERSATEKEIFHTFFIFDIESAIYDKNVEGCFVSDKMVKLYNKIYLLEYNYSNCVESNALIPTASIKLGDISNSMISFFKNLTSTMTKTSNFLLNIVSKAILDSNFSSIIYFQSSGLHLLIDKCIIDPNLFSNTKLNLWNKLNDQSIYNSESTLVPLIERFHNYCSYFKSYFALKNEEKNEIIASQFNNLTHALDDLKLVLFHLSGKIMTNEDLLFNIESTGDLYELINNENPYIHRTPIDFHTIDQYLIDWHECSERGKESIISSFREICQDEYLNESNVYCTNFTSDCPYELEQLNNLENSTPSLSHSNLELDSELISSRDQIQECNLNKSVIGINDELKRIKHSKSNHCNKFSNFSERHTRSCLSIPNYVKLAKHSETPLSKILFAVNTARRRVREYRHKQQANKDSEASEINETIKPFQSNSEKYVFWNKTLPKRPVFPYNENNEIEPDPPNECSKKEEIEIDIKPSTSKKDVEIQVNIVDSNDNSEYCATQEDTNNENDVNKAGISQNDSKEVAENYIYKNQLLGSDLLNGWTGIGNNFYKNSVSYNPVNTFQLNYQRPIVYQHSNCSPMFPGQNMGFGAFSGRPGNGNNYYFHRVM